MMFTAHYPYLIAAPDYRESSLGIQVLHRLCHLINERGGNAWMVGCKVNDEWNAPALTEEAYSQVMSGGTPWIAVYPEVTTGNPFSAPVVVRYMLNREGVIMGNGIEAGPEDLFFWYRAEFADKEPDPIILGIESYDLSLFEDDNPVKDKDFLYLNRIPQSVIDFSLLPENITILSMQNPLSLRDLASLLKRGRVLYTYESSGTCLLANLCGCPVVALSAPGYEQYALNEQTLKDIGGAGFGYSDSPESLENIRASLHIAREFLLKKRRAMETQLDNFLALTQAKAQQQHEEQHRASFGGWLAHRTLPQAWTAQTVLLHVILCQDAQENEIAASLASLAQQGVDTQSVLLVAPASHINVSRFNASSVGASEWITCITQLAEAQAFDWLHCIDAGAEYTPASIGLMRQMLAEAGACQAIISDEAIRHESGDVTPVRKPDFNLDLFLASPHRYLRRVWFRREGWLAAGGFNPDLRHAFESELVIHYLLEWGTGTIGHIADVVTLTPEAIFSRHSQEEEQQILSAYLQRRGYPEAQLERQNNAAWRLIYHPPQNETVSILLDAGDDPALLVRCIESLMNNTDWPHKEVLLAVSENASEPMRDVIRQIQAVMPLKVLVCEAQQNYPSRINHLEKNATGDYLLLLNLHTLFVLKNWLKTLLSHAVRAEVGCVGPKIITTDQRLLSAGVIVGARGWAGHAGQGEPWQSEGYMSRYQCDQNYSALSGNCLLIRRDAWQRIEGLPTCYDDEHAIDIVASLTLSASGYLAVWTPYSVVASDNALLCEAVCVSENPQRQLLMASAPRYFIDDPAYNRNCALQDPLFVTDIAPANWLTSLSPAHSCVLLINNGGTAEYVQRITHLFQMMAAEGEIVLKQGSPSLTVPDILRAAPGTVVLTDAPNAALSARLVAANAVAPLRVLALADSGGPVNNVPAPDAAVNQWLTWSGEREILLAKRKMAAVRLPVLLSREDIAMPDREPSARRRVLCIPGSLSDKEREFVGRIIAATREHLDWVLLGNWPKAWIPLVAETVRWQGERLSGEQLQRLRIHSAVLFRQNSDHNRFKDDYLAVQLVAGGCRVIVSDVPSLRNALPILRLKADPQQWQQALINTERNPVSADELRPYIWDPQNIPTAIRTLFM